MTRFIKIWNEQYLQYDDFCRISLLIQAFSFYSVSSCLKVETIDKALFRAQEYLKTVKEHPEKDNGNVILSSPLVVDFGNMQVEDFLMLKSYEKVSRFSYIPS